MAASKNGRSQEGLPLLGRASHPQGALRWAAVTFGRRGVPFASDHRSTLELHMVYQWSCNVSVIRRGVIEPALPQPAAAAASSQLLPALATHPARLFQAQEPPHA
jgi:hypothetical protein